MNETIKLPIIADFATRQFYAEKANVTALVICHSKLTRQFLLFVHAQIARVTPGDLSSLISSSCH